MVALSGSQRVTDGHRWRLAAVVAVLACVVAMTKAQTDTTVRSKNLVFIVVFCAELVG